MGIVAADRVSGVSEYYFSSKLREIRESGRDVINLAIGSPDLPPHPSVVEALTNEALNPGNHAYQSYQGIPALREAYAGWYKKYFRVNLDPKFEILPLIGSKEGIMHITMAFVNPGDKVLVPNPGYPSYQSVTNLAGGEIITYDLEEELGWKPDLEKLKQMDHSGTKLMWINYPNMPTGSNVDLNFYQQLIQIAKDNNFLVINDNPYSFILNESPISLLAADPEMNHALELNSLSKSFNMAGWRVGMVAGHADHIKKILVFKSNMDSGMFLPVQKAAVKALQLGIEWYKDLNTVYQKRKKLAQDILDLLQCEYNDDQTGMFIWARIPEGITSGKDYSEKILKETDVFIAPGFIFGSQGDRYIRISLCSKEEKFKKAEQRIKDTF